MSEKIQEHIEKVLVSIKENNEIIANDDGYYVYYPINKGYYNAFELRVIAAELDRRNAKWDTQVQDYFKEERTNLYNNEG